MTNDKSKTTTKTGPQELAFSVDSPEVQAYLEMAKIMGTVFDTSTEEGVEDLRVQYNRWVASGKPKPEMPKLEESPIPLKFYRLRHLGKQKMYYQDTRGKAHGKVIDEKPVYRQVKDAQTGQMIDDLVRIDRTTRYTLDFTKIEADKLVDDAMMRAHNPAFFFIVGSDTFSVTSRDFTAGDFDEIIQKIRERKYTAV